MAKKGSARRQPDPDLEDEELELDAPPRKKSSARADKPSAKSSSVKRKSAEGGSSKDKNGASSVSKKSTLKDSGKRKSASGSSPAASGRRRSDDDDEDMGSSRRRRAVPAKKKDNTVVIGVSVLSVTLLLVLGIVVINKNRTPVQTVDEQKDFDDYKKYDETAMAAFRAFNKAEKEGNASVASAKHKEAHSNWTKAMDILNGILANHQGPDGMTHPDYEGYEEELSRIAQHLVDLEKRGTLR
jgi:hypothetical protein